MADTFQLYGRKDGKPVFEYGPKKFSADWGGVFTAFEVVNKLTKRSKGALGTSQAPMRRIGKIAEKTNLAMWMERLNMILSSLNLDNLFINATDVNFILPDKVLPSQLVTFDGHSAAPAEPVAKALIKMGLNKWGVVKELTAALSKFEGEVKEGRLSATVNVTV